jgi:hypothetical protein
MSWNTSVTSGATWMRVVYAFWLNKLSEFNGNFERAEMVKAFIVSGEYRDHFPR